MVITKNLLLLFLKKDHCLEKLKYTVTFVLIPQTLNLKIQSEGDNLFDVCMNAKNKAKKTITQLINQLNQPHRDIQLKHFKKFPYIQIIFYWYSSHVSFNHQNYKSSCL